MSTLKLPVDVTALLMKLGLVAALGAASVFLGFLAATSNLKLVSLAIGAMLGGMLLLSPRANLWLAIVLSLTTGAFLSFAGGAAGKLELSFVLIAQVLLLPFLLNFLPRPKLPAFMWIFAGFIVLSVASSLLSWHASSFISGMKRYYGALSILLAFAVMKMNAVDNQRMRKTLTWIALLQLPFVLYEAFVLVPIRRNILGPDATSEVTDVIAGTFGANLYGGSPGQEMVAFVLIMLAFAWARWREGLLAGKKFAIFALLMLPCITLGEIKYVVILFPMMALVLYKEDILANPARFVPGAIAIGLMTVAFVYLYFGYFSGASVQEGWDNMVSYNLEKVGYGRVKLNRTSVLTFWWQNQGLHDPVGFLLGHGVGSSFYSSDPNAASGLIGARYPWHGIALTTAATLLWEVGIVGFLVYVSIYVVAFIQAVRAYKKATDPETRSTLMGIQAAIALFVAYIPYVASMVGFFCFQVVIAIVLGYLAQILLRPDALTSSAPRTHP